MNVRIDEGVVVATMAAHEARQLAKDLDPEALVRPDRRWTHLRPSVAAALLFAADEIMREAS